MSVHYLIFVQKNARTSISNRKKNIKYATNAVFADRIIS